MASSIASEETPPSSRSPTKPSLAQIQHEKEARVWHERLLQLNQRRHQRFARQLADLQQRHTNVLEMAVKAQKQTKALQTVLRHICQAQRLWAQQMQWGVMYELESQQEQQQQQQNQNAIEDTENDGDEDAPQNQSFSTALYGPQQQDYDPSSSSSTIANSDQQSPSINQNESSTHSFVSASSCMGRTTRHMVHKIQTMGIQTLTHALHRLEQIATTLMEQHEELEHVGRTAFQALQESQTKVEMSWNKYLLDCQLKNNNSTSAETDQNGTASSTHSVKKSSLKQSSTPASSFLSSPHEQIAQGLRSRSNSHHHHEDDPSMDIRQQSKDQPYKQNANLRAMEHAAGVAASYADVWLSEWSYRAHVLEQVTLWEGAHERLHQLFTKLQETETTRRYQFQQDITKVLEHQQKLAVNLEATATVGLMDYWQRQNQFLERQERADEISSMTMKHRFSDGSNSNKDPGGASADSSKHENEVNAITKSETNEATGTEPATSNKDDKSAKTPPLTLPSLTKSGYVTFTTLAKRSSMDRTSSTMSLMVMTTDGILYFFDLPSASKVPFQSSTSVAQAWEAVLAAEFQKQLDNTKSARSSDFVIVVPPPLPSLRFVLAQCSVEMTSIDDCEAKFCIPESQGEDFRIELVSARAQIAFIDAFHACKFQEEEMSMDDNDDDDDDGSAEISDISEADLKEGELKDEDADTDSALELDVSLSFEEG